MKLCGVWCVNGVRSSNTVVIVSSSLGMRVVLLYVHMRVRCVLALNDRAKGRLSVLRGETVGLDAFRVSGSLCGQI